MSLVLLTAGPVVGAPSIELEAELGLGGWVVPGRFAPLRVEIVATSEVRGVLEVIVPGAGGGSITHTHALQLGAGTRQQIAFDVTVVDPRRPVTLLVRSDGETIARRELAFGAARAAEGVVVALTPERAGLEFLAAAGGRRRAAYLGETTLPSRWQSYDAADLVVLHGVPLRALLPAQQEALSGWVAQGGRLLVIASAGLPVPAWLDPLLPARVSSTVVRVPGIPVALARLIPEAGAGITGGADLPRAVRGRFGRGVVEIWAFDPFSAGGRAWPERLRLWLALLSTPRPEPAAPPALADELPKTRPLPGSVQVILAALSIAYIVTVRVVLRRWGTRRAGWLLVPLVAGAFATALYAFASGARGAARAIAQVSVMEALPGAQRARVTTFVSFITPYGGSVTARLPPDGAVRLLGEGRLILDEGAHAVTGSARSGMAALQITQIVDLDLRASVVDAEEALHLVLSGSGPPPLDGVLYRRRQIYRLGPGRLLPRTTLDAARWVALDRPGVLGIDLTARASELLLARLEDRPEEMWLVGRFPEERTALRLPGGGVGESSQIIALPVSLP